MPVCRFNLQVHLHLAFFFSPIGFSIMSFWNHGIFNSVHFFLYALYELIFFANFIICIASKKFHYKSRMVNGPSTWNLIGSGLQVEITAPNFYSLNQGMQFRTVPEFRHFSGTVWYYIPNGTFRHTVLSRTNCKRLVRCNAYACPCPFRFVLACKACKGLAKG
ncbi:unnamed protein product [Musa textilis]